LVPWIRIVTDSLTRSGSELQQADYTYGPSTERGRARRDQIIAAATQLFYQRGFYATGIDDIGAAAGITGPGVYRHFAGKDEILIAVLDRIWMMLRAGIDAAEDLAPKEALDLLIQTHVRLSVTQRAEFTLLIEDLRFLPDDYQELASSNRAKYQDSWALSIAAVYPHLTLEQARFGTAAIWRLSSGSADAMYASGMTDDELRSLLEAISHAAVRGLGGHRGG
jgi:AcrR family transcriptional regulator